MMSKRLRMSESEGGMTRAVQLALSLSSVDTTKQKSQRRPPSDY